MNRAIKALGLISVGSLMTIGIVQQSPKRWAEELKSIKNSNPKKSDDKYRQAITESCKKLLQWKTIQMIPGLIVGVSIRGQNVWLMAEGLADVENDVPCNEKTVMRIGSISKSITASLLAKMVEEKKIDLDKSVYEYLDENQFPRKKWDDKPVDITLRQLSAHLGGIRHYKKVKNDENGDEFESSEYYFNHHYPSAINSLEIFKDDPLVAEPGTKFVYTTFGYTLLSAIMESQMKTKNFGKELIKYIREDLGLNSTHLDENDKIILNRSRFYRSSNKKGELINVPAVDNSYKWAGGGLLSNVPDLLKFGNMMLYSFKGQDGRGRLGYLSSKIVDEMWTPMPNSSVVKDKTNGYGIGFFVNRNSKSLTAFTSEQIFENLASHSGGSVGASSMLLIEPNNEIVIALIVNKQEAKGISRIATEIAQIFAKNSNFVKDSSS
ncbi:Serine beta-lactamase-like protein LACTB [Sarcoptes scabiei]|uniref:Beta-lactamase-related domain-containing protein n=1 Tax=Sarcoptes scabiei TaxID=52283 RepID=A0A132AGT7_SARSC|nr:Serine beta-lactamase-like protein LACTB [Sarcoptes scabiei]KPM09775.1 hypothetical protein QR98_0083200 [Sarcoptes scabiei]